MPPVEEYIEIIKPLWDSAWLTNMGSYHCKLEKALREYLDAKRLSLFANGHLALELTLQAMNLKGEVITTPFTFASTTHAIVRNGLTPVFCDINSKDYTMDAHKIESLITSRTTALLPVHVYGNPCNIEEIDRIAKKYSLKVIYDAAHAFGVKIEDRGIGTFGDAAMFSFHATKVFHTIEGGAVTFSDPNLAEILYELKNFGIKDEEIIDGIGSNAKMNEFQAAMGLCNLLHLEEEVEKRKKVYERYTHILSSISGFKLIKENKRVKSNYGYFPVVFNEEELGFSRDDLYLRLREENIYPRKYFYPLTNNLRCYEGRFNSDDTPVAREIANSVLTLPLYADLPLEMVDKICDIILSFKDSKSKKG